MSQAFQRLDHRVQKWIYKQQWSDLREIQKLAIEPILKAQTDVIISASTAAGKTEAFFLPACSAIADQENGFGILYISPLKALINDQYRRLENLCEMLDMPVTPWHGDSSYARKQRIKKMPAGILLITPESLEARLIKDAGWVRKAFSSLAYIVIDEFHAFIGLERGIHLLSLLHRLESLLDRQTQPIPRIALSATLGDLSSIPRVLRPDQKMDCVIITGQTHGSNLKMQVRGYCDPVDLSDTQVTSGMDQVCQALYSICRGDSHLVFANSRKNTEIITATLRDLCEQNHVPNEFFAHHGSLSKELREELEARLQKETLPTTAICTMTLELGIDIGKVNSVAQVTAPHSVSSLRQRLGRSGRRNSPSILRMLIIENELSVKSGITDKLRLQLLQSLAIVRLLISEQWFEPADTRQFHFSTLIHQILAILAQWGSAQAGSLYQQLCTTGPFSKISVSHFKQLLAHMGQLDLLIQLASGELVLGLEGERIVGHYSFYAVFQTPEEYRVINKGHTLGSLPMTSPMLIGESLIFAGRRWLILDICTEKKTIFVEPQKGGRPPLFEGNGIDIHDRIRQEMFSIYCQADYRIKAGATSIDFLDATAKGLFAEGLKYFQDSSLEQEWLLENGPNVCLFLWRGDKTIRTLMHLLRRTGFEVEQFGGVIEISKSNKQDVLKALQNILQTPLPTATELAELVPEKQIEKFDCYLPPALLAEGYGQKFFDIDATIHWLREKL